MNKVERVYAALEGEPVDFVPVSFWGHYLDQEGNAEALAASMLASYRRMDYDFLKVHPRASYHVEDWGSIFTPSPDGVAFPKVSNAVVRETKDWYGLRHLEADKGALGEQLEALRLIDEGLNGEALYIQTVFSPMTIANTLVGGDPSVLRDHVNEDPAALHHGLSVIAESYAPYVRRCVELGAAGLFFSCTIGVSRDLMTEAEYREFGVPYDLRVLEPTRGSARFNMLHLCKANVMFELAEEYPVHCVNWSPAERGNPSLSEGLKRTSKAVAAGMGEKSTLQGPVDEVVQEAGRALAETNGRRHLLTGGCSLQIKITPEENLRAARETAIAQAAS